MEIWKCPNDQLSQEKNKNINFLWENKCIKNLGHLMALIQSPKSTEKILSPAKWSTVKKLNTFV